MATITQIRGALLEEAVLFLLRKIGYETVDLAALASGAADGMRAGHSGLEVQGRGTWHQLDAFALWKHSPAFMYPMKLVVEAKCYAAHRPVGVETVRNAVGVLKDISENYFSIRSRTGSEIRAPRYNYASAIFSTSGFTRGAVEYAIAHQVFLIQYEDVPVIQPLVDAILAFDDRCITASGQSAISAARRFYRLELNGEHADPEAFPELTDEGIDHLRGPVRRACRAIQGSYFGMLQGRWPLHLLRHEPLPAMAFADDVVSCIVVGNEAGEWSFVPVHAHRSDHERWFELEFSLPPAIAELVEGSWGDPVAVANLKMQHFSYIDLSGVIGGIRRNIRLELDEGWIRHYIRRQSNR